MREMVWFESDDDALITKVTTVYEESIVLPQLQAKTLYPSEGRRAIPKKCKEASV